MKSLIASVALLFVVTVFVFTSTAALRSYCDTLLNDIKLLDDNGLADPGAICGKWARDKNKILFVADRREVEKIDNAMLELKNGYDNGDEASYRSALQKLIYALEELKEINGITPHNIF